MIKTTHLQIGAIVVLLSSCGMAQYEDVSLDPKYLPLVGQQLEATTELYLHAVTLDPNYAQQVDTCVVTAPPGFSGPELVYRRTLAAGTAFHVLSVRRCVNCPFDERVEMMVHSTGNASCGESPITIDHSLLGSGVRAMSIRGGT